MLVDREDKNEKAMRSSHTTSTNKNLSSQKISQLLLHSLSLAEIMSMLSTLCSRRSFKRSCVWNKPDDEEIS